MHWVREVRVSGVQEAACGEADPALWTAYPATLVGMENGCASCRKAGARMMRDYEIRIR